MEAPPWRLSGCTLTFTRYSFVGLGIVLKSILFLALDTSFIAPLCMLQSILGNIWFTPPEPPVFLTYNIGIDSANIV